MHDYAMRSVGQSERKRERLRRKDLEKGIGFKPRIEDSMRQIDSRLT